MTGRMNEDEGPGRGGPCPSTYTALAISSSTPFVLFSLAHALLYTQAHTKHEGDLSFVLVAVCPGLAYLN
jgi:hypothetical protein